MNKKAQVMGYLIAIGLVLALVYFYTLRQSAANELTTNFPGELQLYLLSAAQYGEMTLVTLNEKAEAAANDALFPLAEQGGTNGKCGTYLGYQLWSKQCKNNINGNYEELFNKEMRKALPSVDQKFQLSEKFFLTLNTKDGFFKLSQEKKRLVGMRDAPAEASIYYQAPTVQPRKVGAYTFRLYFDREMTYDYSRLEDVQGAISSLFSFQQPLPVGSFSHKSLDMKWGGCMPTNEKELFYDVIEKTQWCVVAEEEACTCDLAQIDLKLLGDKYIIEFKTENGVVAYLKDKTKQGSEDEILETYHFEETFGLGRMVAGKELMPVVQSAKTMRLDWNGANMYWAEGGGEAMAISREKGLFHEKKEGKTSVAFTIDEQRRNTLDDGPSPYDKLPACIPAQKKFRMCIDEGKIDGKPLLFKIAVDTS